MKPNKPFIVGVIEGFFGRPWPWADRRAAIGFLAEMGMDFYIYAPKADRYLRKAWTEPWPAADFEKLAKLCSDHRAAGLGFGLGFSPFEIYREDPDGQRSALKAKVAELNRIGPTILSIQFDDMHGAIPELAERQARVVGEILAASTAARFIVCPTYYSDDPRLERVFGAMPAGYLEDLGRLIDPAVDIYWTGPKIFSDSYPSDHLERVAGQLRRKPFLWDNYPVNDSARTSNFLHLAGFTGRPPRLKAEAAGHAVNPMNQAWLSRIAIASLADSYAEGEAYDPQASCRTACRRYCGEDLGAALLADLPLFQDKGLSGLDDAARQALIARYRAFAGSPYASEVADWLGGGYAFDPSCLSD
jgi:hypothetical protein